MNLRNNGNDYQQFDKAQRVAYLIAGYIKNTLSEKERDELDDWICEDDANQDTFLELIDPEFLKKANIERDNFDSNTAIKSIREKLQFSQPVATPVKSLWRRLAPLTAVAALLLLLALVYWMRTGSLPSPENLPESNLLASLQPGSSKATLTIGSGKMFTLDSLSESLIQSDGLRVDKGNGELIYASNGQHVEMHTLSVPRGGQYQLILPDGSKVWLNAESSIRFPSAMNGEERVVEVTGELYFDVKRDPARKFIVKAKNLTTEVLGTRFNINLHGMNGNAAVFLQEGSVRVGVEANPSASRILKPGEMLLEANQQVSITRPNSETVLGWKNGWFEFSDAPIEQIMEEVKRWYDVDVKYAGTINYHINASIERNLPAAGLLELLEMTGQVHFELKDKTIIVKH